MFLRLIQRAHTVGNCQNMKTRAFKEGRQTVHNGGIIVSEEDGRSIKGHGFLPHPQPYRTHIPQGEEVLGGEKSLVMWTRPLVSDEAKGLTRPIVGIDNLIEYSRFSS